ncbi:uracil-DNA glycosylase family protein [Entomobacter blattae]|uniref:Uracil DNA glycosylase superfamily protein n=1 Tax=Entomobacter blattae TaxID=2762277 RepID=A0A7H1NP12_9PROT|nr:uracil-DNA glycosylase family protein [Entomobacter blattae]QNT77522.1 Uracil DNA glycosylase superfamily protein [Entomobacter blattae]
MVVEQNVAEQKKDSLASLLAEIRACHFCQDLPLGARPVLHVSRTARLLISSQAPGTKVHETGISFNDASGDRLREWLGLSRDVFYDSTRIAIVPMGLCYPGKYVRGGDKPPRKECAPLWRARIMENLPDIRLTLLVGGYAQAYALGPGSVTERVREYKKYLPRFFPLPHPSWRTKAWEKKNPWFEKVLLPDLKQQVQTLLEYVPAGQ